MKEDKIIVFFLFSKTAESSLCCILTQPVFFYPHKALYDKCYPLTVPVKRATWPIQADVVWEEVADTDCYMPVIYGSVFNSLGPRQKGRHFANDIFKCIFLNEIIWIPIKISLKFVPKGPINNIPAFV